MCFDMNGIVGVFSSMDYDVFWEMTFRLTCQVGPVSYKNIVLFNKIIYLLEYQLCTVFTDKHLNESLRI